MDSRVARRPWLAIVVAVWLLGGMVLAGCAGGVPADTPGITGTITYVALSQTPPPLASITVEGGAQPDGAVSDKAVVAITEKTAIFDAQGARVDAQTLRVGQQVKVWFTGPVAESYPVQGTASAVQIVSAAAP
jgi:beta-N-acetylhexosaminidase